MRKEIGIAASAFTLATGIGVALNSPDSPCEGEQRFTVRGEVMICETQEGILIQGKDTPSWILPENVTSIYQAWGLWRDPTKAGWYTTESCNITYHRLDMLTGEETSETYCIPSAFW